MTIIEARKKAGAGSQDELLGIPKQPSAQCDIIDALKEQLDIITANCMEIENNLTKAGIRTSLVDSQTDEIIRQVTESKQTAAHLRQNIISLRTWGFSWRDAARTLFQTGNIRSVVLPKFWDILGLSKK